MLILTLLGGLLLVTQVRAADDHDHDHDHGDHSHDDGHGHGGGEAHADEVTLDAEAIRRHGITTGTARLATLPETFRAPARVAFDAEAMAHVGTPIEGRVTEVNAVLGDAVEQGQVLLTIESPALGEAESAYLRMQAAARAAQTALNVAKTTYERSKALLEGKGLALGEFQRREGDYRIAEGQALAAEAEAQAAENTLRLYGMSAERIDRLRVTGRIDAAYALRAPLPGHVVEREVTLGEIVGPDRDRLLVIADTERLWMLADVPEAQLARVALGRPARATVEALGARPFAGEVAYIAPQLNPATRTAQVRVVIDRGDAPLRPGMFGQVEFSQGTEATQGGAAQVLIPEAALQTVEGGPAVFVPVEGEPNTFAKRAIRPGKAAGGLLAVEQGLQPGETVVATGSFILKAELGKAGAAHEH